MMLGLCGGDGETRRWAVEGSVRLVSTSSSHPYLVDKTQRLEMASWHKCRVTTHSAAESVQCCETTCLLHSRGAAKMDGQDEGISRMTVPEVGIRSLWMF